MAERILPSPDRALVFAKRLSGQAWKWMDILPMSCEKVLFASALGLFCQVWSWVAWAFMQMFLLENGVYARLRYASFLKWSYLPPESLSGRLEGIFGGILFGAIGVHLNLVSSNPRNLYREIDLPYLGVCVNVGIWMLIMRELSLPGKSPCPEKFELISFLKFTLRQKASHRLFAGATAFLMAFGTWLFPWCCVR